MKAAAIFICLSLFLTTAPPSLAQKKIGAANAFPVKILVNNGKKAKEKTATLTFSENSFSVKKNGAVVKEFNYADIEGFDYAYSSEPFLSPKMRLAAQLVFGIWSIPLLFMKKKRHWLTIRTKNDFIVIRLNKRKYQILDEFESRRPRRKIL